jgi:hypothetical protein
LKEDVEKFNEIIKSHDMIDSLKEFKHLCLSLFVENKNIKYCTNNSSICYFLEFICEKLYSYNSIKKYVNEFYSVKDIKELECENFKDKRIVLINSLIFGSKLINKKYEGKKNIVIESMFKKEIPKDIEKYFENDNNFLTVVFWATDFYNL